MARSALDAGGPVEAVGVANQRASTIVWDRTTGEPLGPGIGWQDLRTVFDCIMAKADLGLALAPNQSATKVAWLRIFQIRLGNSPSSNTSTVDTISVAFIERGVTIGSAELAGLIHMALRKRR